jgi:FKBP-type peptidyl-prolyl cis-trans isomerase (trigger factor)
MSEKEVLTYVAKRYGYSAGLALLRAKAREQAKNEIEELNAARRERRELMAKLLNEPTIEIAEQTKAALGREAELRAAINEKTADLRAAMRPIRKTVKFYDGVIVAALSTAGYDTNPRTELDPVDTKLIIETRRKAKAEAKA